MGKSTGSPNVSSPLTSRPIKKQPSKLAGKSVNMAPPVASVVPGAVVQGAHSEPGGCQPTLPAGLRHAPPNSCAATKRIDSPK